MPRQSSDLRFVALSCPRPRPSLLTAQHGTPTVQVPGSKMKDIACSDSLGRGQFGCWTIIKTELLCNFVFERRALGQCRALRSQAQRPQTGASSESVIQFFNGGRLLHAPRTRGPGRAVGSTRARSTVLTPGLSTMDGMEYLVWSKERRSSTA